MESKYYILFEFLIKETLDTNDGYLSFKDIVDVKKLSFDCDKYYYQKQDEKKAHEYMNSVILSDKVCNNSYRETQTFSLQDLINLNKLNRNKYIKNFKFVIRDPPENSLVKACFGFPIETKFNKPLRYKISNCYVSINLCNEEITPIQALLIFYYYPYLTSKHLKCSEIIKAKKRKNIMLLMCPNYINNGNGVINIIFDVSKAIDNGKKIYYDKVNHIFTMHYDNFDDIDFSLFNLIRPNNGIFNSCYY